MVLSTMSMLHLSNVFTKGHVAPNINFVSSDRVDGQMSPSEYAALAFTTLTLMTAVIPFLLLESVTIINSS